MCGLPPFDFPKGACLNGRMFSRPAFARFRHHGGSLLTGL